MFANTYLLKTSTLYSSLVLHSTVLTNDDDNICHCCQLDIKIEREGEARQHTGVSRGGTLRG